MTIRSSLALISTFVFASLCQAEAVQDIEQLRQHVQSHTATYYRSVYGESEFEKNVQINVGHLDTRLRLAECDDNLTFKIHEPPHNARNITVKTTCTSERRWTVYVPVSLDVYAEVLVATRSLQRGHVVDADDLELKRMNTSTVGRGYIGDLARAVGMEIKRPIKPGDVVRLPHLARHDIVHKGQTVVVSTQSRFLRVETSGVALVDGHLGERIRVKNERSNRVVSAEVTAPGKVTVATR